MKGLVWGVSGAIGHGLKSFLLHGCLLYVGMLGDGFSLRFRGGFGFGGSFVFTVCASFQISATSFQIVISWPHMVLFQDLDFLYFAQGCLRFDQKDHGKMVTRMCLQAWELIHFHAFCHGFHQVGVYSSQGFTGSFLKAISTSAIYNPKSQLRF